MYISSNRIHSRETFKGSGTNIGGPINLSFSTPMMLEGVYSWRTGVSNSADTAQNPPLKQQRGQDGWGLITPSNPKSLSQRARYIEDFARMMVPAQNDAGAPSTTRTSTTDTGHPFGTLKVLRYPIRATVSLNLGSGRTYNGDMWSLPLQDLVNETPYTFGLPAGDVSPLTISNANRQAKANHYFAMTAPDRKIGSIGSTLVELVRGDIPTLLKNFQEMMAAYKTVRNYVGSEGLNIMFGWTPLIQEYANIIKVGMGLERVIYYESFRRKRQWEGPTYNSDLPGGGFTFLGTPYRTLEAYTLPGDVVGPSSGFSAIGKAQGSRVASEDYHFSSKYTGLAKAGRRANSFSDQAMDVAKRMGAIDDPELIWDLTPYSWLLDWFTTMGESIHNAHVYSPFLGKYTSDYAYVTTKHLVSIKQTLLKGPTLSAVPGVQSFSVTRAQGEHTSVSKWRARATPFGFGTQLGSLSASQFAILVALGFAKTR